jgi:hypothetical protein
MHLSFMPVQYRDLIANIQATNNLLYLTQRRDPKVIITSDAHATGGTITLDDAPRSHPSVQEYSCETRQSTRPLPGKGSARKNIHAAIQDNHRQEHGAYRVQGLWQDMVQLATSRHPRFLRLRRGHGRIYPPPPR